MIRYIHNHKFNKAGESMMKLFFVCFLFFYFFNFLFSLYITIKFNLFKIKNNYTGILLVSILYEEKKEHYQILLKLIIIRIN